MGATTAVAAVAGCTPGDPEAISGDEPAVVTGFKEGEWVPTGCAGCTSWCSMEANVVDGRVIKIRGNAKSKVNGAANCVRSHMSIQQLYDPDRVKVPMKRTNPNKGVNQDPGFVPISWDEAADTIADKLMELRATEETHKFVLWRGRYTQLNQNLYGRVPAILGSPNNISHSSICAEAEKFGPYYSQAYWGYRDYDLANVKYMLCWGVDPISTNRAISYYTSAWGDLMDRATVTVVDPRFSPTAAKADEWLPVKTGYDGALASAMAHVILTKGLWCRTFVGDFADGTNKFVLGQEVNEADFNEKETSGVVKWWNLELKDKTPEWAAELTDIPADQIERVATEFGEAGSGGACWMGGGPVMQVRGAYNSMAVYALNGLVGSVDVTVWEGSSTAHQNMPDNADFIDEIADAGRKHQKIDQRGYKNMPAMASGRPGSGVVTNNCAQAIIDEDPYDIKVAIGYWVNLNFSAPGTDRWNEALAKIPFFVHIPTNQSEMSHFADILLPSTHHMYEQWGYLSQKADGYTHIWLSSPMIDRVWDTKNPETEIIWLIAEKMADKGFTNLLDYFKSVKDPDTGATPTTPEEFELYATKHRLSPIWDPADNRGDDFSSWEEFKEAGVWNSDRYVVKKQWGGNFGTETGKFEFYSETLKKALQTHADKYTTSIDDILETCDYLARGEQAFVPHYEDPVIAGDPGEYPLLFVDSKSRFNREGRSANCTWYYDVKDADPGDERGDDVIRINPQDGSALGISSGDKVKVISPSGELNCTAKLWEATPPGSVVKAFGQGHWSYGRVAADGFGSKYAPKGGNNNDIIPAVYDRLSGSTVYYGSTRVKIVKA